MVYFTPCLPVRPRSILIFSNLHTSSKLLLSFRFPTRCLHFSSPQYRVTCIIKLLICGSKQTISKGKLNKSLKYLLADRGILFYTCLFPFRRICKRTTTTSFVIRVCVSACPHATFRLSLEDFNEI